ncbi:unnamed protein product [Cyprideis torosa]|uniref:Uncharacterized protein n=1 Tax=Cyprideis torosa TaxID=163714 RepID=A0A7R8WUG3_9CRUS|nr:unnamed protein product [Cyprideis torosa]CAG0910628.1 unnamed protein product [Cyprideis torosa]
MCYSRPPARRPPAPTTPLDLSVKTVRQTADSTADHQRPVSRTSSSVDAHQRPLSRQSGSSAVQPYASQPSPQLPSHPPHAAWNKALEVQQWIERSHAAQQHVASGSGTPPETTHARDENPRRVPESSPGGRLPSIHTLVSRKPSTTAIAPSAEEHRTKVFSPSQ